MIRKSKTHGNRRYDVNLNDVREFISNDKLSTRQVVDHFKFWLDCYSCNSLSLSESARRRCQRFIAGLD